MKVKEKIVLVWIISFFGLLFLITLLGGLLLLLLKLTKIDWAGVINSLFAFSLELTSLAIAFVLGQVYWERRNKQQKNKQLIKITRSYLQRIVTLSDLTFKLLEPKSSSSDGQTIDEKRMNASKNLSQLQGLSDIFFDSFSTNEPELADILPIEFINSIKPRIDHMASYSNVTGHTEEIRDHLENLIKTCSQLDSLLTNKEAG